MKTNVRFNFLLFVTILGLAACMPVAPAQPGESPQEASDSFETQVAAKVGTNQAEAAQAVDMTVEAALALTVAAGGDAVPTTGAQPTDIPPTAAPTSLPEPSATLTPLPSPTFTSDDPATVLGLADFQDTFDNSTNWSPYDAAGSKAVIQNGKFIFTKKVIAGGSHWTLSWQTIEDYYLQATVQTPGACSGFDRYGFIFRAPDPSVGLLFMVSCNGQYKLAKWDGTDTTTIVNWTNAGAINTGPNVTNRIGVMVQGEAITLYVNGVKLVTALDSQYVGQYRFGLLVGAGDTEPFTVKFDDLAYWLLP